jgi:DMSO/TMAO reductase YedYZ heme-binding membrane subunit
MAAVTSALDVRGESSSRYSAASRSQRANQYIGLAAASALPALFWVAVAATAAPVIGISLSAQFLAGLGAAIALFVGIICAPIIFKV